jgi:hypothetical protein
MPVDLYVGGLRVFKKLVIAAVAVLGLGGIGVVAASTVQTPVADVNGSVGGQSKHEVYVNDQGNEDDDLTYQSDMTPTVTPTETTPFTYTFPFSNSNKVALDISDYFSVSITSVVQLHDSGWGFGEIYKLYSYADKTGKTPAEIQAMRDSGMGWGEIAKALDLAPGNAGDNLGGVMSGRNVTTDTQTIKQKSTIHTETHQNNGSQNKGGRDNGNHNSGNGGNGNGGGNGGGKSGKKP